MIIYIVTVLFFLAIYLLTTFGKGKFANSKWKKIPTETGPPIIGVVNRMEKPLHKYLLKLSQKHGPIFQIKFGMRKIVVFNTFEYIKAVLVDNGDAFSGRWKAQRYVFGGDNSGLIFVDGDVWVKQKAFVLKCLREVGVGRPRSIEIIEDECRFLLRDLEQTKGKSLDMSGVLNLYVTNVILKFVMNKGFRRGDPEMEKISNFIEVLVNRNDPVSNFILMFPILDKFEWLIKFVIWITSRRSLWDECHALFEKEIKEHLSKLDFNSEGDDLIDRFFIKQHQLKERNRDVETFTEFQLIRNAFELLFAGYDTTATSLVWFFMFMAIYQDVQTKVHEEIVDKIGTERIPTMSDRVSLVYTLAVIDEMYRLTSIGPLALRHRALSDVNIKGYLIPKNTLIINNLFACHIDPNTWKKPLEFYPEHFLFTDNNGSLRYKAREDVIPFGLGKRNCIGESLARTVVFIFFTSVVQKFHIRLVGEIPQFDVFNANEGIVRTPNIEDFIFDART